MSSAAAPLNSDAAATRCPDVSAGPPAITNAGKRILHQKRWVCDTCKVKWFLDFNEACAHEEKCTGGGAAAATTLDPAAAAIKKPKGCQAEASKNSIASGEERGASPTITPPPQSKKAAAILAAARARARGKLQHDDVVNDKKSVEIDILSDSDDDNNSNAIADKVNEVEFLDGPPPNDGDRNCRRKSKRLRDATPPAKSNHDSSSQEMNGMKKPKAVIKMIKPTIKSSTDATTSLKTKTTEKKGGDRGGQIASIFLPKSKQQQHRKVDTNSNHSKKRAVETKDHQSKSHQHKSIKSSSDNNKREVLVIDCSSDDDDDDDDDEDEEDEIVVVKKTKQTTKTRNVTLGLSKEELGEHRAADFFARRKKKAEEERERQRKRDQERLARMNSKDVSLNIGVDLTKDVVEFNNVASSTSNDDDDDAAAAIVVGETTVKNLSFLHSTTQSSKDTKGISAPRFPCPSHIVPDSNDKDAASKSPKASSYVLSKTPKFQYLKTEMTASSNEDDDAAMPMGFLDEPEQINSDHNIFSSFFNCSTIQKKLGESPSSAGQLWVDKYTMRRIPDDVMGADNKEASKKLIEFVEEWKVRRHKAMQSLGRVKRKKKRRKKKKISNWYDTDDSFLDDGGLESVFLISGPTGSGKTRLVAAVAEQCECVVIEINTSEQRSGQALKRAVQETTQSHSSLAISKRKAGPFVNNADDLADSECDSDEESKEDGHSLTIILIDEVDLLFDEDTAFWPALAQLSQKAKCPIVLTATSVPAQLYYNDAMRYKSIELRRPCPDECCDKIDQVRKLEGMTLREGVDRDGSGISSIAEFYECDIRKILNEMQLFRYTQPCDSGFIQRNLVLQESAALISVIDEDCPVILDINPRILPRDRYTVLTIKGKNFFQSELFIGGKPCEHFAVVSDSKVIAICPPCVLPEGVTRDAIYKDDQRLDCLSCKFTEVVMRKKCPNSGLVLDSKSLFGSDPSRRTNWNVEYDIPLRESKFDQLMSRKEFIRHSKAQLKRQQNTTDLGFMSSDEEFEKNDPLEVPPIEKVEAIEEEQQSEVAESETMSGFDAQVLLNDALSNIDILQFSPKMEKLMISGETLQQNAVELSSFANELARFSDASLLESSFACHVPPISGAVEGFGSHLFDSTIESDPTIDKLCKGKNTKPPSFDVIYQTGVNDSGFFFGCSNSYICHPNKPRERQLLCLSEMKSRGLGRLYNEFKEEIVEQDSNSDFVAENSNSIFSLTPFRSDSEDDMLLSSTMPSSFDMLPSLLMKRRVELLDENLTVDKSAWLDSRRNQMWKDSLYSMYEILTHGNSWCFCLRHGASTLEEISQRSTISVAGDALLGFPLSLDYLPYLREIARYENMARFRVKEMMDINEVQPMRKTRSSRRNVRRHYLEEFYPGRFRGNIEIICAQLAYRHINKSTSALI